MFPEISKAAEKLKEFFNGVFSAVPLEKAKAFFDEYTEKYTEKQRIAAIGGFLAVLLAAGCFLLADGGEAPAEPNRDIPIYIKVRSGMNAKEIGEELKRHGIVNSKYEFWLKAKFNGYESKFIAGSYEFRKGMEVQEVLDKLVRGEATECKFVIPEGFTVLDIAKRLEEEGIIADRGDFLDQAEHYAPLKYMEESPEALYRAEGFLFPATYTMDIDVGTAEILDVMTHTFDQRLTPSMRRRAREMDLSIYELVTLASLVEKEARYEEDRPIIAQVFFKRLKLDMPLQSDATLQYLMDAPKEDVSIEDTKIDSPYNTYQHKGLPPGPVANPGTESMEAVLYPADTDYLYFVADREGHNHYSYTYEEHLRIVEQVR